MYRGTMLTCPACSAALEYAQSSLLVHRCTACGGMWLGPEATVHLMYAPGDGVEAEILASSPKRTNTAGPRLLVGDEQARHCPSCDLEMAPLLVGKTRVDSCPAHGTWFDHDEVRLVVEAVAAMKAGRRGDADAIALSDVVDGTTTVVVGTLKIGFSLVADLLWWITMAPSGHPRLCDCQECKP